MISLGSRRGPFADDAPNFEELVAPKNDGENPGDNPHLDPNNVIETDDLEEAALDEEESEYYYAPTYVDREYIVVAVNPKMKRYMARSVDL